MKNGMTVTEKILARAAGVSKVSPGQFLDCKVDQVATMDLQGKLVLTTFKSLGLTRPKDPDRIAIVLDHQSPSNAVVYSEIHSDIRRMAGELEIKDLYDVGQGILHVVLPEKGHVLPGELVIANESHTPTSGAVGAVVLGVGQTDAAVALATGEIWLMVPETIKVNLFGRLNPMVAAKDVGLKLMSILRYEDKAIYRTIEVGGPEIKSIAMDGRFTITNFCSDMGAKSAIVEPDEVTEAFLKGRAKRSYTPVYSDPDCRYAETIDVDLDSLEPLAACPHALDNIKPVKEVAGVRIHQAVLGTCTNGRVDDFKAAAEIIEGKKVHPGVRFIVRPASQEVYLKAMKHGYLESLAEAGALIFPPGCGSCYGEHSGLLAGGEVAISTSNRNMRGRMGSKEAEIYLASPETVTASAITGVITDPRAV